MQQGAPRDAHARWWLGVALASGSLATAHPGDNAPQLPELWNIAPYGTNGGVAYTAGAIGNGVACLSTDVAGLAIIELTPDPVWVGQYGFGSGIPDVAMIDHFAIVPRLSNEGVEIVDISSPSEPSLVASIRADADIGRRDHVAVRGTLLLATRRDSADVLIADMSNPVEPTVVRELVTPELTGIVSAEVVGNRVFLTGLDGSTPDGFGAAFVYDLDALLANEDALIREEPLDVGDVMSTLPSSGLGYRLLTTNPVGGSVRLLDASGQVLSQVDASSYGLSAYSPGPGVILDDRAFVAWHQAGVQVFRIPFVDGFGDVPRLGFAPTSFQSPLLGPVGTIDVEPSPDGATLAATDDRFGLFAIDVRPTSICLCEADDDSGVQITDLLAYLTDFFAGSPNADVDTNGTTSVEDLLTFLVCWFAGGCS